MFCELEEGPNLLVRPTARAGSAAAAALSVPYPGPVNRTRRLTPGPRGGVQKRCPRPENPVSRPGLGRSVPHEIVAPLFDLSATETGGGRRRPASNAVGRDRRPRE